MADKADSAFDFCLAARGKTLVFDLVAMPRLKSGWSVALLGRAQSRLTERL
jgi:hypothetical protein